MKLSKIGKEEKEMEMRGVEPRTFHMRSERSTTELQPRGKSEVYIFLNLIFEQLHKIYV